MPALIKLFGPPGTGKTTRLVKDVLPLVLPEKVAVVSLTRATKKAFLEKCMENQIPIKNRNVRTLHSWCFASIKENGLKKRHIRNQP